MSCQTLTGVFLGTPCINMKVKSATKFIPLVIMIVSQSRVASPRLENCDETRVSIIMMMIE